MFALSMPLARRAVRVVRKFHMRDSLTEEEPVMYGHSPKASERPHFEVDAAGRSSQRSALSDGNPGNNGAATHAVVVRREDAYCSCDFIVMLHHVFGYGERTAYRLMRALEKVNHAVVWVGSREAAESHSRQVQRYFPPRRVNLNVEISSQRDGSLPPVVVIVEPVNGSHGLPANVTATAAFSERERLEHEIFSRSDYRQLARRSPGEIARLVADVVIAAGYRSEREPSLEAVKPLLVELIRLADPMLRPEKHFVKVEIPAGTHRMGPHPVPNVCTLQCRQLPTAGVQK